MEKTSKDFLKSLLRESSPSGYENSAATIWRNYATGFAKEVRGDYHGNSYAVLNPRASTSILMSGHIDEIGLMVKAITEQGFLKIAPVGGIDPHVLAGQRVYVHTKKGPVFGVLGRKAIHLQKKEDTKKVSEISDMWIDIGVKDKKEADKIIEIGDVATIAVDFQKIRKNIYVARGFDDRIGAFAVLEALKLLSGEKGLKHKVTAVATVQEEIGVRGAITSTYNVHPQIGFAVDVTHTSDMPGIDKDLFGDIKLGDGPVIARGPNINPRLFELLVKTARDNKIPHKVIAESRGTGTDANAIQLSRGGIATGLVSIPNRYMHTPVEVVSLDDVENCSILLAKTIMSIRSDEDFII
ncbi:MAG: M42 family metallopeptidase [Candidatus Fermentibacteraceae bacterium]|nr:M42 family metallopeptidase [Candidatus Fermentibacteraceae bacterium]MBN2609828.1 M42 family metallopeptidase [Candidatus Fermentibacteraceae bacterium]